MPADQAAVDAAIERFARERDDYERAGAFAVNVVKEALAPAGIESQVFYRVKEVTSYRAKVMSKQYDDPWEQVTDKLGARAIVTRPSDVDEVHRLLVADGRLEVVDITDKRSGRDIDTLAYSGLHLDLRVPCNGVGGERLPCELQIRTSAQDAWSVVSHKLLYKPTKGELPFADQRAIMRLVALVELFDGEVERVMNKLPATAAPESEQVTDLTSVVAAQYARFEDNEGNAELTHTVLRVVATSLAEDAITDYRATLADWVHSHEQDLATLYADYGPRSDMATSSSYLLWSQPESLALLECLDNRPNSLMRAWRDVGLPDAWIRPLAAHTAAQID